MNESIIRLSYAGGLFAIFAFVHFFVDWIFQSHDDAMVKHNNPLIRAKHCFIYTFGFFPLIYFLNFTYLESIISSNILFWSHFYLDTYHGVFVWAKYIRKPPEMTEPSKELYTRFDGQIAFKVHPPDSKKGFLEFIETPIGKILMITIDQIFHLTFLFPLIWIAIHHL